MSNNIVTTLGNIGKVCMCKRVLKEQTMQVGDVPFYKISTFGEQADCYISRELYEDLKNKYSFPKKGDILISAAGTIGRLVIYDGEDAFFQDSNIVWLENDEKQVTNEFLYYFYLTNPWVRTFGSTIPRLYNDDIKMVSIEFPKDIETQNKITRILKTIDSKISNNKKICNYIDDITRLIFNYWFIQYDFPDNDGNPYKSNNGKMRYDVSLKRNIPESWKVLPLNEGIYSINTGLNPRNNFKLNTGGNINYVTVKNILLNGEIDFTSCDKINKEAYECVHNRSDIKKGDILLASISPFGRCYMITENPTSWDINESVFSIRPNHTNMTSTFLYLTLTSDYFVKKAEACSAGSIFKGIRISEIENMLFPFPPMEILNKFELKTISLFKQKSNIFEENQKLVALRNYLLPMLLNGQVTVNE